MTSARCARRSSPRSGPGRERRSLDDPLGRSLQLECRLEHRSMSGPHPHPSAPALLPLRWRVREPPLEPAAAVATGPTARALARRLLAMPDDRLRELHGVAGGEVLLVVGGGGGPPLGGGGPDPGRGPGGPGAAVPA